MNTVEIRWRELTTPNRRPYERGSYNECQVVQNGRILHRAEVTQDAVQWCAANGYEVVGTNRQRENS